ncbi:BLUF domain-containing protein [Undibacterium sp. RTI2.2]|nr:BLUF domain-containing protein [Undibacterium sp. RTI2.2]MEB0118876.1 BLUF domain-containing protein [Undibacterium sp. RTI2.2]
MALIQLVYTSSLVNNAPEVMADILQTARSINKLRNITGMLLCANGGILQVLEGEDADVSKTYRSIELDKRHNDIFLLSRAEVAERKFATWDMGFRRLTDTEISNSPIAAEVFNADRNEIGNRVKPGAVLTMLVLFGEGIEMLE